MPIFVIEIVIDFSEQAVLVLKNSDRNRQKSITEQTWLFQCNRFHCAENRQSPSQFFQEVGGTYNIYGLRVLCMT